MPARGPVGREVYNPLKLLWDLSGKLLSNSKRRGLVQPPDFFSKTSKKAFDGTLPDAYTHSSRRLDAFRDAKTQKKLKSDSMSRFMKRGSLKTE